MKSCMHRAALFSYKVEVTSGIRYITRSCHNTVIDLSLVCKLILQEVMAQWYVYMVKNLIHSTPIHHLLQVHKNILRSRAF